MHGGAAVRVRIRLVACTAVSAVVVVVVVVVNSSGLLSCRFVGFYN